MPGSVVSQAAERGRSLLIKVLQHRWFFHFNAWKTLASPSDRSECGGEGTRPAGGSINRQLIDISKSQPKIHFRKIDLIFPPDVLQGLLELRFILGMHHKHTGSTVASKGLAFIV